MTPMGREYKIKCRIPGSSELTAMFRRLPSPIHEQPLTEIYNYKIEADGFYFIDHLVDTKNCFGGAAYFHRRRFGFKPDD